jgi:hypothetical protein
VAGAAEMFTPQKPAAITGIDRGLKIARYVIE